ncbi:MAG: hypothetical protein JO127_01160 [Caulobacteraceae bacterium]|nr:hypothetical protein [Caulobacteraceae bacterium]
MNAPPLPPRRLSPAVQFRGEIERAEADGVARDDMTLRLTFGDASQLKRDVSVPLADISFTKGVMRFLGVKVTQGGVAVSVLERS